MKRSILLLLLVSFIAIAYSNTSPKADSLIQITENSSNQLAVLHAYLAWDELVYAKYPDSSIYLNSKVVEKAKEYLDKVSDSSLIADIKLEMSSALNNLGSTYNQQGDYKKALDFHVRSLAIKKEICYKQGIAVSLNNIGYVYLLQVNTAKALDYFHQSLKIREEIGDKRGVAGSLINLGTMYFHQEEMEKALNYYFKSIDILEEIDDQKRMAYAYINIGHILSAQNKTDEATVYLNKCLKIYETIQYPKGVADVYNNLGGINLRLKKHTLALEQFKEALQIYTEINSKKGIASSTNNMAKTYLLLKDYNKTIKLSKQGLSMAEDYKLNLEIRHASNNLYQAYEALGKDREAYKMFQLYISTRDTILSEENQKQAIKQEFKYAYEKQATADSIQMMEAKKVMDAQIAAQKAEIKQERTQRFALYGGVFMLILFGGFIYNRLRITRHQNILIEQKKKEVEVKNKEILDSINYAKRIQKAILPPDHIVEEYLKDSFILYKPKDIVAGDFYWMDKENDTVLFAAADCTGHGVPGAMVSVVCNNGLNRAVKEFSLSEPGEILDKTREIIVQEFEKSDEEVQDGMDIALCSLKGNHLHYAGAHNPLWIIRNGEIIEIKATKQPIGKYDNPKPYLTHQFDLEKEDVIYIFSDGYVDQFGGEKGKKLKAKPFKKMLLDIQDLSMPEQKTYLDNAFETWRGELEQIDDVCVIGVKIG